MDEKKVWQVIIADEQPHVRSALRLLLEQEIDFAVVGEVADGRDLLLGLAQQPVDILLLDWQLPGLPIPHLLHQLKRDWPSLQLVAMSTRPEDRHQAVQSNIPLFISKSAPPDTVLATLRYSFFSLP